MNNLYLILKFNMKNVLTNLQNDFLIDARRKEKSQFCKAIELFHSIKPLDQLDTKITVMTTLTFYK